MKKLIYALVSFVFFAIALDYFAFNTPWAPAPHLSVLKNVKPEPTKEKSGVALLINGGFGVGKNHRRYWNNLSLMYIALKAQGWRKIIVLDADGTKGLPDQEKRSFLGMFSTGSMVDSSFDLDQDGVDDVSGAATRRELELAINKVKNEVQPNEEIFIFLTDHGQLRWDSGLDTVAMLWHEELTSKDFAKMIDVLPKENRLTILAAQCHSSLFLKPIQRANTELIASGFPLWIWSTQDYSVFPYHFAAALLGIDPLNGKPLDTKAEARMSFEKAYEIAKSNDHAPEWPVRNEIPMNTNMEITSTDK
ncbi:MAG: hypothetical protein IPJ84_14745 [Bdellovibrionales bacterium]|nr:hypothetical protein [Bdellovibrionales bacterium]